MKIGWKSVCRAISKYWSRNWKKKGVLLMKISGQLEKVSFKEV